MKEYSVIIYIKEDPKEFSVTARQESSRLKEVNKDQKKKGFRVELAGEKMNESDANALKKKIEADYLSKGYEKVPRKAI